MRTNDQYFEPGDKVMKVAKDRPPNFKGKGVKHANPPKYGKVYCVTHFWRGKYCNLVLFAGYETHYSDRGSLIGFYANNYRKVEEIKLCVGALEHGKKAEGVTA